MNSYRVLVTGCPRSGTHFVERQLRDAGLLVRHERMGVQGTVSSLFCVEDFYYLNDRQSPPRLSACQFEHVVHLVRDPRDCIPSMALNLPARFWRWQEKHTEIMGDLEPAVLRAALFWHVWNGIIEDTFPGAQRIRIEDWPSEWPNLAAKIGAEPRPVLDTHPSKTEHARLRWEDIEDIQLRETVRSRAISYGYTED